MFNCKQNKLPYYFRRNIYSIIKKAEVRSLTYQCTSTFYIHIKMFFSILLNYILLSILDVDAWFQVLTVHLATIEGEDV